MGTGLRGGMGGETGGKNCSQVLSAKRDEEGGRRCEVEEEEKEKVKRGKSSERVSVLQEGEEEMRDVEQGERNGEKRIEAVMSEEEERRRKLWEGERRRNEERRRREEERRREEKQGDRWRLGREVRGGEGEEDEEERKRREEATRSNARMERRWNELTSSTRWNGGGQQKEEMEEKRQETHLGPAAAAGGSYEGGERRRRREGGGGEEDDEDLPEHRRQLSTEMMVRAKSSLQTQSDDLNISTLTSIITWGRRGAISKCHLARVSADTQLCWPRSAICSTFLQKHLCNCAMYTSKHLEGLSLNCHHQR